jgi:hypothetical protein
VILEHSVLGLHTCLVPVFLSSPLLSCIPCLGSALQYILCACSVHSFPVCITSTSILASLRCTCFVIARQILSTPCRHSGQTPHRTHRTLRPTDRNMVDQGIQVTLLIHLRSIVLYRTIECLYYNSDIRE